MMCVCATHFTMLHESKYLPLSVSRSLTQSLNLPNVIYYDTIYLYRLEIYREKKGGYIAEAIRNQSASSKKDK